MKSTPLAAALCAGVWIAGCAGMEYVKVPTPTQYQTWTDEDQRDADAMKGVRYYLPRPFVHLKKSVPVAQRVAFVSFAYDATEHCYKLVPPTNPPTWLTRVVPDKISITQALAALVAREKSDDAEQQSGEVEEDTEAPDAQPPPSTLKATTGYVNETDPVTALSDLMDVVYLPDFEEQYVIRVKSGLGSAEVETKLRNGWAAEVFTQQVDNSGLIPYVIRQVESASEAAAGIVTDWAPVAAGLPPGTSPASLIETGLGGDAGAMQSGDVAGAGNAVKEMLGDVLLFKIAEVRTAQPGLYPILKPREIEQWLDFDGTVAGPDPQAAFELFLQASNVPWIRPDMAFVPCPPFTVVGFNATTDVFLMPATERATIAAASSASPRGDAADKLADAKKAIADALERSNGAAGVSADSALIKSDKITVAPDTAGNGVEITIAAPPVGPAAFASTTAALEAWIVGVFSVSGSPAVPASDVQATLDTAKKKAVIKIAMPLTDVAARAAKVP